MKLLVFEYGEFKPPKGCYGGCHTRWRGLESDLLAMSAPPPFEGLICLRPLGFKYVSVNIFDRQPTQMLKELLLI